MRREEGYFRGCLLGGAIGDAYAAPVKFMPYDKIIELYGDGGSGLFNKKNKELATITDDTQLTLFTAEGLLRSIARCEEKCMPRTNKDTAMVVFRAYLRWLYTQGLKTPNWQSNAYDGWLIKIKKLHGYRDPGVTCITSLGKGIMGTFEKPTNTSEKCGTVIRIAPVGLVESEENVFDVGARVGAITHGAPSAYYASGALAYIIYCIIEGSTIEHATRKTIHYLEANEPDKVCAGALQQALELAKEQQVGVEHIHAFGSGFMAHEALGIGVYAALTYKDDFKKGLLFAACQSGNSNSTAVIAGSILGAYLGIDHIDEQLIKNLELNKEIDEMAKDLYRRYQNTQDWKIKYPGW